MSTVTLAELAEMEHPDEELVPEILPVDARLSIRGSVKLLLPLFERAAAIVPLPGRETLPGTSYALLESYTEEGSPRVRLTATDGFITTSTETDDVSVVMEGGVLVPPKKILDILKKAPTSTVVITVLGNAALVRSGRAQWTVAVPVGDELALPPHSAEAALYAVDTGEFVAALVIARRAMATSGRAGLLQAEIRDGSITATDGRRIHRQFMESWPTDLFMSLPSKLVDELLNLLRKRSQEELLVGLNAGSLMFKIGSDTVQASRLMIPFPNIEKHLLGPAFSNDHTLIVNPTELLEVVGRVRISSDPDYSSVTLALVPGKKAANGDVPWTLVVRARDKTGNAAQEGMDCDFEGPAKPRELWVNHRYLSEFLMSVPDGETIALKIGDDTKASRNPIYIEHVKGGFTGVLQQMSAR